MMKVSESEFRKSVGDLYEQVCVVEEVEVDCLEALEECCCKRCPYRKVCEQQELFYGCPCWEEYMGEDL